MGAQAHHFEACQKLGFMTSLQCGRADALGGHGFSIGMNPQAIGLQKLGG
jgi:hypothetical protein